MSTVGPAARHQQLAPEAHTIRVALVTASDSRTPATNEGGRTLRRLVEAAGFTVAGEALLVEDPETLAGHVRALVKSGSADAILITGGTGIGPRDRTPEAIGALFERRLPGFGELFRMLSFQEIGAAAMLSRSDAGVIGGALVFLLPGSPAALELAVDKLIGPQLPHMLGQLRRPVSRPSVARDPESEHGG